MSERFNHSLVPPSASGNEGKEGTIEREYITSMSEADWQTINYLVLNRIEQDAAGIERLTADKDSGLQSAISQRQQEAFGLNDMLTRWLESGAPVVAKEEKGDHRRLDFALPASWRRGEDQVNDVHTYPKDGSLGVLQKVRENTNPAVTSEVREQTVTARPQDWNVVRKLLAGVRAKETKDISDNKVKIDLGSFGRSYANAAVQNEMNITPANAIQRGRKIPEDTGRSFTDQEAMSMVNKRLAEIEERLPTD